MCENEQKPELESEPLKTELWSRSHIHENQELQDLEPCSWKKSCGAGAVTILGRLRGPEIIQTVAGHIDDPE